MVNDIKKDAEDRMSKSVQALVEAFKKVRTGRANPAILDGVMVDYYGCQHYCGRCPLAGDQPVGKKPGTGH